MSASDQQPPSRKPRGRRSLVIRRIDHVGDPVGLAFLESPETNGDAVLERNDSARRLDSLERSSLLVVPLDRDRSAYRYRRLVRDFLRSELERRDPELVAVLNRRAADWCEANGYAHNLAVNSKGDLFITETYEGKRVQRFVQVGARSPK